VVDAEDISEVRAPLMATGVWLRSASSPAGRPPVGLGGSRVITVISVAVALWLAQGHTTPGRHLTGGQCGGV
jgi:CBS-domain-containing membrane protein